MEIWQDRSRRDDLLRLRVAALAQAWEEKARNMSLVGGESPRPRDYSEGHYVGTMKSYYAAAEALRELLREDA